MSNKPQTPLNSPEVTKDTTSVMTPEVPATVAATVAATVPPSMKDTTDKSVPLPTVQPTVNDQDGLDDDGFDPAFPLIASVSEFTVEADEAGIKAYHDSGYIFVGTHAEFNRHARESIKLFKHA